MARENFLLPRLSPFTPRAFYGIVLRLTKVSQIMHNISYRYRANTPSSLGCIIKNDLHKFLAGPVHFTVGFTVALKCNPGISAVSLRSCEHCKKKKCWKLLLMHAVLVIELQGLDINYSLLTVFGGVNARSGETCPVLAVEVMNAVMNVLRGSCVRGGGVRLSWSLPAEVSRGYGWWVWQPQLLQINTPQK